MRQAGGKTGKERRRQARQKLAALPEQALAGRGRLFAERLTALPEYRQARTIFCYLSVEREPDTAPILRQALAEGKVVCAPVCLEKGLMRDDGYDNGVQPPWPMIFLIEK